MRIVEERSRRHSSLISTVLTFIFSIGNLPKFIVVAPGTAKALRPAKAGQIVNALLLGAKFLLKLL